MTLICGIVLAAGAGSRFGGPKALARTPVGEPWIARAVATLRGGGCDEVLVALGAGRAEAAPLVPPGAVAVEVPQWVSGVSASIRAALGTASAGAAAAALIVPVDTPTMPAAVVTRLAAVAGRDALARAVYAGAPGHPVLIGRKWWDAVAAAVTGDRGAGPYLAAHAATRIECGDLWDGADIDRPLAPAPA